MQVFYTRLIKSLSREDNATIATWRIRVIAAYAIILTAVVAFLVVDTRPDKQVRDQGAQLSKVATSSKK